MSKDYKVTYGRNKIMRMSKIKDIFNRITLRDYYEKKYAKQYDTMLRDLIDATSYTYPPKIIKGVKGAKLKSISCKGPLILLGNLTMSELTVTGGSKKRLTSSATPLKEVNP